MSGTQGYDLSQAGTFAPGNQFGDVSGNAVLILPFRRIGLLMPHVVVDETHRDDLVITDHPVEKGAEITDHAFKRPPEVTIRAGWSNSGYGEGYVQAVYTAMLALQASRVPFTVVTGKRLYTNMLISSMSTTTDVATEKALLVTVSLKSIIIVRTQETTVAPASAQASPDKTGGVENAGTVQPVAAPAPRASALQSMFGGPR